MDNQTAGDLADVGAVRGPGGTQLSAAARKDPGGDQTLSMLGYLVGAVQAGASETSGIHTDLVRRIEAAARFAKPGAGALARAFEPCLRAGIRGGPQRRLTPRR